MKNFIPLAFIITILTLVCSCKKDCVQQKEVKFEVYAGSTPGYQDGPRLQSKFENPFLIAKAPDKSLYIVESSIAGQRPWVGDGIRIRKISPDGIVSTFLDFSNCGSITNIRGIAVSKSNEVYISEGNQIKKISKDGNHISVVAGTGASNIMKDGPALQATFWEPSGLAFNKEGCLFIMDTQNNAIRVLSKGEVSTLAGGNRNFDPDRNEPADGKGSNATFDSPQFITLDENDNVYVSGGYFPIIRKITPEGAVTTIFGNLFFNNDRLETIRGVTFYDNNLYFNYNYYNPVGSRIHFYLGKLSLPDFGLVKIFEIDEHYDNSPPTTGNNLNFPTGLTISENKLFICNMGESRIRRVDLNAFKTH